jgi:hypothetical protein
MGLLSLYITQHLKPYAIKYPTYMFYNIRGGAWTGITWLRKGTGCRLVKTVTNLESIKCSDFLDRSSNHQGLKKASAAQRYLDSKLSQDIHFYRFTCICSKFSNTIQEMYVKAVTKMSSGMKI